MENVKILAFARQWNRSNIVNPSKKQAEFSVWGETPCFFGLAVLFYGKLMRRVSQFPAVRLLLLSSVVVVFHFRGQAD